MSIFLLSLIASFIDVSFRVEAANLAPGATSVQVAILRLVIAFPTMLAHSPIPSIISVPIIITAIFVVDAATAILIIVDAATAILIVVFTAPSAFHCCFLCIKRSNDCVIKLEVKRIVKKNIF